MVVNSKRAVLAVVTVLALVALVGTIFYMNTGTEYNDRTLYLEVVPLEAEGDASFTTVTQNGTQKLETEPPSASVTVMNSAQNVTSEDLVTSTLIYRAHIVDSQEVSPDGQIMETINKSTEIKKPVRQSFEGDQAAQVDSEFDSLDGPFIVMTDIGPLYIEVISEDG